MSSKFKKSILSLFFPVILLAITACPGIIIDHIQINFDAKGAVTSAVVTFSCLSPITENIVTYKWFFGDGTTAEGQMATHIYNAAGTFVVECHIVTQDSVLIFAENLKIEPFIDLAFNCDNDLCVTSSKGGPIVALTMGTTEPRPTWSPDGTTFVFSCDSDVCTIPTVGGTITNITNAGIGGSRPRWSPDGSLIAFGCSGTDVCIVDSAGGVPTNLTNTVDADQLHRWAPDSSEIVYQCTNANDICVVTTGGVVANLTSGNGSSDGTPVFSPDGTQIAFECDSDICLIPSGGGAITALGLSGGPTTPEWSPNGTLISFTCENADAVCVIPSGGGAFTQVFNDPNMLTVDKPKWSPDGQFFAFFCEDSRAVPDDDDICVVSSSGGAVTNLTFVSGLNIDNDFMEWRP
jgi:dipeptidyl aminopeptidase/acylaminoacyl peptidase